MGQVKKVCGCPKGTLKVAILSKYPDGRVVKGFECLPKPTLKARQRQE